MNKIDELLALLQKKEKEEETCKCKNTILWILAIVGAVAAVAGIAYAVYRFFTPDYLEDFEDDFEDDLDEYFEDLKDVEVIGFENLVGIAYKAGGNKEKRKALKALYKKFCAPKIRQGVIPKTLAEYLGEEE